MYELDYFSDDFPKILALVAKVVTTTRMLDEAHYQRDKAKEEKVQAMTEYDQAKRQLEYGKAGVELELLEAREYITNLPVIDISR